MSTAPADTARDLDWRRRWRALRLPIVTVATAFVLLAGLAALGRTSNNAPLDPRNPNPGGAQALAALVVNRGVELTVVTDLDQLRAVEGTIMLSQPAALSSTALAAIARSRATVVVVDPPAAALEDLDVPATVDAVGGRVTVPPGCPLPAAHTAGTVQVSGTRYAVQAGATGCYPVSGDAALVISSRPSGGRTLVLGSGSTLSNARLASAGNAALALGLLNTRTVAWVPGALDTGMPVGSAHGLFALLPRRLEWASLTLVIAVAVLALWRARRLGPPVVEPLPVVVRAAETVEGSGRLLHAARARDHAADSLRRATIRRLTAALHAGPDDPPDAVVTLAAARVPLPADQVRDLLYGPPPADDAALVRLAQGLADLEHHAHRDNGAPSHPVSTRPVGGQR
jgi:hypothetical protein